ncbi:MAG: Gfo/Idh/MocA family oxidoreductase [Clostridia bacterium]|nr:Gfo/Idh/MocA family oxidoreductase [Clostridia bacterium]
MKVKWGVIGCGGIADRRTLPGMMLAENAELVAVMDTNLDAATRCKDKYHAKYAFNRAEDLLALDEIQAVYIASPVFCHKDQCALAAKAKKHILLEKPMGLTTTEASEIAALCKEEGVLLGVAFMMRFHSYHQKMKELIQSGHWVKLSRQEHSLPAGIPKWSTAGDRTEPSREAVQCWTWQSMPST